MLKKTQQITPNFNPKWVIKYHRPLSVKSEYYYHLIVNEATRYINNIIELLNEDDYLLRQQDWYTDTMAKLQVRFNDVIEVIKEHLYFVEFMDPKSQDFDKNPQHKTNTFIIQLLKVALVKIYLELQDMYSNLGTEIKISEFDIYDRFFNQSLPENSFLVQLRDDASSDISKLVNLEVIDLSRNSIKELPKEYRNLIGFNKLQPVFDEYGTVINLSPERVGGVNQKTPGIKLEELNKEQAKALRKQIKDDALSLEKSTKQNKIFSGLKWNNDIGAFEVANGDVATQADIKQYAADNPMEIKVGEKPVEVATNKSVLANVGKTMARIGAPLPTAVLDSYFIGQQVKEGKGTAEIASDPLNWVGLAAMEPLSKVSGIAESGKLNSALRLGLNPATIRGISRFAGLPGLAVSTAMTAYDQYKKYQNEEGFIYNLFNKEEK